MEREKAEEEREKLDAVARVKGVEEENDILREKLGECDMWVKSTLELMTPAGRSEFRTAARAAQHTFPLGTNRRLRTSIGLNVSKPGAPTTREDTELMREVVKFAMRHSIEVPDTRKASKGIRYYTNYLCVLHQLFLAETDFSISYSAFCSYWPPNIQKPGHDGWGTCLVTDK